MRHSAFIFVTGVASIVLFVLATTVIIQGYAVVTGGNVEILSPRNGASVSGDVVIIAKAPGSQRVSFSVDGIPLATFISQPPYYGAIWRSDGAQWNNGQHVITAIGSSWFSQIGRQSIMVFKGPAQTGPATVQEEERVLVKFKPHASAQQRADVAARHQLKKKSDISAIGVEIFTVPSEDTAEEVADRMKVNEQLDVEFAEPDGIYVLTEIPNDSLFSQQWALEKIGASSAWDITTGSDALNTAVLDSGIDYDHPDLMGRVILGPDYVNGDNDPRDDHGHGTRMAGIVAAATNNSVGIAGLDWRGKVLVIKVCTATSSCAWSAVASGITYAADHGSRAISISLAGSSGSSTMQSALDYAHKKGIIIACSAGNYNTDQPYYPADYPQCIKVGSTGPSDARSSFSNFGPELDVMAPGEGILTTTPGGGYTGSTGTSPAAPHVAALGTLLAAINPSFSAAQKRDIIQSTAVDLNQLGWDPYFGYGRINMAAALARAKELSQNRDVIPPTAPANLVALVTNTSTTVTLSWSPAFDIGGVAGYKVYRNGIEIGSSTGTQYYDNTGQSGTTYTYTVRAFDAWDNYSPLSNAASATIPTIFAVTSYSVTAKSATTATISWTTNLPSTGSVRYGASSLQMTALNSTLALTHIVVLTSLQPNTNYQYQITAQTPDNRQASSPVSKFRTRSAGGRK